MEDIEHYDIPVYNFPYDVEEDDEDTIQDNSELRVSEQIENVIKLMIILRNRLCYRSLSSAPRRKLRLTASPFARASTLGESPKSTTQGTPTSAG